MLFLRKVLLSHGFLFMQSRKFATETASSEIFPKKKYNDTALKKWAIISPMVQPSQMVMLIILICSNFWSNLNLNHLKITSHLSLLLQLKSCP